LRHVDSRGIERIAIHRARLVMVAASRPDIPRLASRPGPKLKKAVRPSLKQV